MTSTMRSSSGPTPTNPLRSRAHRIDYAAVTADDVRDAIDAAVAEAEASFERLLAQPGPYRYESVIEPLDELLERVARVFGYAYHLTTVRSTPELRACFAEAQPRYRAFRARVAADPVLYERLQAVAEHDSSAGLEPLRRRHLDKTLQQLRRSGAGLDAAARERAIELRVRLAELSTRFSEHVLEATQAFHLDLVTEDELVGLPTDVVERARASAAAAGQAGWRFTLQAPSLVPFLRHSRRRDLRERLWRASDARAAQPPHDNRPLVREILAIRRELAGLLGYRDYAEMVLEDRMVADVAAARDFLQTLEARTRPYFEHEIAELRRFAREQLQLDTLEPWDVRFAFERWREARFDLDEAALRPYFALDRVQSAMFELATALFGLRFEAVAAPERWHESVECFEVRDENDVHLGTIYTDWYPREGKRDGAWMNGLIDGGPRTDGGFDPHLGFMCGNLTPGSGDHPALLDFVEVQTLFHEFGHLLHQLLTRVEVRARGQGAVAWDFIELPSQILENWTYEPEALVRFARHVDTDAPIPQQLIDKVLAARNFMEAWAQMRQLSFASVDFALHVDYDPAADEPPERFAQRAMERFEIEPRFASERFLCSFSHIMAGAYAAGYYAYKWSEVLDADAFSRFQREGLYDREVGRAFAESILARGDAEDPATLYATFMGRPPRIDALIERNLGPLPVGAEDGSAAPR